MLKKCSVNKCDNYIILFNYLTYVKDITIKTFSISFK